jgi:broad specificity phosphatase PhoE
MAMPRHLILVRHGESEGNFANARDRSGQSVPKRFLNRHPSNWRLTARGQRQAKAAGAWLRKHGPKSYRRYYVSTYNRAVETAGLLGLPNAQWTTESRLRERDMGKFSDLPSERALKYPEELKERSRDGFHWRPPSGESFTDLEVRLNLMLDKLSRKCDGETAIIVCHGEIMWTMIYLLEGLTPAEFRKVNRKGHIENCEIIHYTRMDPRRGSDLMASSFRWVRHICPWDLKRKDTSWQPIRKKRYSNEQLLRMARKFRPIAF